MRRLPAIGASCIANITVTMSWLFVSPKLSALPWRNVQSGRLIRAMLSISLLVSTQVAPGADEKPVPHAMSSIVTSGGSIRSTAERTSRPEYEERSMIKGASGAKNAWKQPRTPMLPQLWMRGSYQYVAL